MSSDIPICPCQTRGVGIVPAFGIMVGIMDGLSIGTCKGDVAFCREEESALSLPIFCIYETGNEC